MNASHEEAVEFSKISKRENRVYVGNLSYDVKYRDLMEFMRGGGWGNLKLVLLLFLRGVGSGAEGRCGDDVAAEDAWHPINCRLRTTWGG
jgi:hypothetical protein